MNKKFSTLMASLLLASAFSTSAYAAGAGAFGTAGVKGKPVTGDVVMLFSASSATLGDNKFVQLAADGTLAEVAFNDAFKGTNGNASAFTNAARTLWKVNVRYSSTTGQPIYQFINKATGAYLAVNLVTDNKGESSAAAKLNAAGNKDWGIDGEGHLYAYKGTAPNDSVFTLKLEDSKFRLYAKPGNAVDAGLSTPLSIATIAEATKDGAPLYEHVPALTLDAASFNAMLGLSNSDGKLHFNGTDKDVTTGQENLLTATNYVAYKNGTNSFYLAEKDKETSDIKNPYLLMVDTLFHNASAKAYPKFKLDTLALTATEVAALKGTSGLATNSYKPTDVSKFVRPAAAAEFTGVYYYGNDSIALSVAGLPSKTALSAITDGTNYYGAYGASATTEITCTADDKAKIPGYSSCNASTGANGNAIQDLKEAIDVWIADVLDGTVTATYGNLKFAETTFSSTNALEAGKVAKADDGVIGLAEAAVKEGGDLVNDPKVEDYKDLIKAAKSLARVTASGDWYFEKGKASAPASGGAQKILLTELAGTRVLTVDASESTFIVPLVQPFTTTGGDAVITTSTKLYRIQIANTTKDKTLKATADNGKYLVATGLTGGDDPRTALVESVDDANVYAQWAFIPGEAGFYQIINRGSEYSLYSGPVSKVKDANGNVVADTYVVGSDTLKLAGVTVTPNVYEEKDGKFDYSGYFYAGPTKDKSYTFSIAPVAAIMTDLGAQFNKDSVMVLGKADEAPVWYFQEAEAKTYGLEIEGMTQLKYMTYKIFTKNANGDSLYVWKNGAKYSVTNKGHEVATFALREANKGQYLFLNGDVKMTINPTPAQPVLEASAIATMRDDYFTITSASSNAYRTLTEEDGVLGNAKIFMNNEPYRYLYENTANIVANNGNKIAKDSLNFLGIYNAAAASKNAAIYVDTAYVDRKGVTMPQYMFALGVEAHEATPAAPCTETGVHVDKDGKATTADKCVHATPAQKAYKSGRYLVSVADSASTAKHPAKYDGAYRLAFVDAIHVEGSDSLIIVNSKYTNNTNVIELGKATTYASKDTLKFENDKPNVATFALLIKDQADKSFYLETANKTYVRILNGVPVLTDNIENAAIFNIEATTEEATANEAIEAATVQVIAGKGVVTVQGAAGKVVTVANILGQTIANQVAASDNVTIAAPAGVLVVTVDGEATKVVVK